MQDAVAIQMLLEICLSETQTVFQPLHCIYTHSWEFQEEEKATHEEALNFLSHKELSCV